MSTFKNNGSLFFLLLVDIFLCYSNFQWKIQANCATLFNSSKCRSRLKFNKPQVSCASIYSNNLNSIHNSITSLVTSEGLSNVGIICFGASFHSVVSCCPNTTTAHLLHHRIQQEILIKILGRGNRVFRKNSGLRRLVSILNSLICHRLNYIFLLEFL